MNTYIYIRDLFQAILNQSIIIEGRFHISHKYGAQEINSDQLGEVLTEIKPIVKYPLALLAPPHSYVSPHEIRGEWEQYRMTMFFVKPTYYSEKGIVNKNLKTATSTHTVLEDWDDMKKPAMDFIRALKNVQRNTTPSLFRINNNKVLVIPVSNVGVDRISGVRIDFDFELFVGCDISDYVTLPTTIV